MKKILALVLSIVMLFTMASCNLFSSTKPQETTPEGTTPGESNPEGTNPEGTKPEDSTVTYKVTVVDENGAPLSGATVQLCVGDICRLPSVTNADGVATFNFDKADYTVKVTLAGYTGEAEYRFDANSTELKVQLTNNSDDSGKPTLPEFEVTLPEVSKIIANIIGVVATSVEVSKDAQLVIVVEQDDGFSESNGEKKVLFFEVAEATLDSDGELLKAQLKAKIGEAIVMLPENGSAEDVVVNKEDITSYYELNVTVNGDDVSVSWNDENASANLSDLVYGEIAKKLGFADVEALKAMLAEVQQSVYIAQELGKNVLPIIEAALGDMIQELPTVSPAYSEHIAELFAALGDDIVTITTDAVTGNTTYSLNIAALKSLVAEIEGKTLAQYLETVYGENVVGSLSSFLKNLPDKKVKDIVDAAVTLAEETGVEIKDIYALIDMYVYSVAGVEFDIEEQINTRYNKTLAELLVEFNGIKPEEEAEFIQGMKDAFTNAANAIETVSIDALLSSMFMGAEEGFIESLKIQNCTLKTEHCKL